MLQLFQVEELEKRYEMGRWEISGSAGYNQSEGFNVKVGVVLK